MELPIHPGSLLTVQQLTVPEISAILSSTARIEALETAKRAAILAGRRVALLFYESSTRTRTSFELAAKSLGATTTLVSDKSSSIEKGESLKDTGLTLRALGAEAIILRHANSGAPYLLARMTGLPVLNAGDGMHEHPSQALLDLRTMLPRLGARVILCGPEPLLPEEALALAPGIEIERDFDKALATANEATPVVMMLRIQKERLAGLDLDLGQYMAHYQLHEERLAAHVPGALVLHPGPMIRGLEIQGEVADGPSSAIEEQVSHGLAVRTALLVRALGVRA
jgi:aspartate carbamoyltransferase catalytic subunit